jgi:membrane protein DedA with SNARE-associated domain/rhodanese-related sulfurtransferase
MPIARDFFVHYGYAILFLWVLAEQLGVPLPSIPLLLTAGTLSGTHDLRQGWAVLSVVAACLVGDTAWFSLGRRFGASMVRLVCRLSLESATCVRRTEDYFQRHGAQTLLLAKFVPGLGTVAAPIAGQTGMRYRIFLLYDLAGALIWSVSVTMVGRFFGDYLNHHPHAWASVGHSAGLLFLLLVAAFLGYRVFKQQAFLRQVRGAKIEPETLKEMLDSGRPVYVVDLRHPLDYLPDPRMIPGAVLLTPSTLRERSAEIPRDQDVVLYCTCPNDATSARTAMQLRRLGIYRVRPLHGGYEGWKRRGYPLVEIGRPTAA